jgi:hypothetical protein
MQGGAQESCLKLEIDNKNIIKNKFPLWGIKGGL